MLPAPVLIVRSTQESHVIKAFRMALDRLLLHRIENPGEHSSVEMTSTIDGIIRLIDSEEHGDLTNVPWQCVEPTPSRAVDGGSGGSGAARVCFDFQAGKCRRGAGCNFAHTAPQGAAAEAGAAQPKPKAAKPVKQQTRAGTPAEASEPAMPRLKIQRELERRHDSDGSGPFCLAEFIEYYGEEQGKQTWDDMDPDPLPTEPSQPEAAASVPKPNGKKGKQKQPANAAKSLPKPAQPKPKNPKGAKSNKQAAAPPGLGFETQPDSGFETQPDR